MIVIDRSRPQEQACGLNFRTIGLRILAYRAYPYRTVL
jgi:hypothetical protein